MSSYRITSGRFMPIVKPAILIWTDLIKSTIVQAPQNNLTVMPDSIPAKDGIFDRHPAF